MQIFTAQTADGTSEEFKYLYGYKPFNIFVTGDLGGGTLQLEALAPDGTTWVPVSESSITEIGMNVATAHPFTGRLVLSGSTTPNIDVWVVGTIIAVTP